MSKKIEESYKKYLFNNFEKLYKCIDERNNSIDTIDTYKQELIAFNNIFGSLVGLIDGKVNNNELENCKKYILKYYESTYPERQLEAIDSALYSKDCYEYIKYAEKHLIIDKIDLELLKEFSLAYIKGYNLSREVTLKSVLSYYTKKIIDYSTKLDNLKEDEKLYQL